MLKKVAFLLVLLMVLLQAFYGIYAFVEPLAFVDIRGTDLVSAGDTDWVKIYASRTLFIALIIAVLLYFRDYRLLVWAALLGTVMPVTDAWLAYQSGAAASVVIKHVATVCYLAITCVVLGIAVRQEARKRRY